MPHFTSRDRALTKAEKPLPVGDLPGKEFSCYETQGRALTTVARPMIADGLRFLARTPRASIGVGQLDAHLRHLACELRLDSGGLELALHGAGLAEAQFPEPEKKL